MAIYTIADLHLSINFPAKARIHGNIQCLDDDVLDAIEEALLATDMGVDTTMKIIENLEERVSRDKYVSLDELVDILRSHDIGKVLGIAIGKVSCFHLLGRTRTCAAIVAVSIGILE